MSEQKSLQERYAPRSICFGCGPANKQGLRIRSFPEGDDVVAHFLPASYHEAFPGMINGGIIGSLLDCHCNWTAAWTLMKSSDQDQPPCTVTAQYTITLKKPTPSGKELQLRARPDSATLKKDRVWIDGELLVDGVVTATCRGLFVAVKAGHPAYHRW